MKRFCQLTCTAFVALAAIPPASATLDAGPGPNSTTYSFEIDANKKIVTVVDFKAIGTAARNRIARLEITCVVDTTFNSGDGTNGSVFCVAVQADQKVLVGGSFTTTNVDPARRSERSWRGFSPHSGNRTVIQRVLDSHRHQADSTPL